MKIKIAKTDSEILSCFEILQQLRPHLKKEDFISQIRRQERQGYKLVFIEEDKKVISVAGFRLTEKLSKGKFVFVDDLVTDKENRSKGYGEKLIQWIIELAKENNCNVFELDSGVEKFDAHRFYLKHRMKISCHHFSLNLGIKNKGLRENQI